MYQNFERRPRQRGSYFLPFLSLIILGLIVVLVFQIADYFQQKRVQSMQNKAAVKVVTGRADMKIWGVDQWTQALDGGLLSEGDAIRTGPGSRVVLSLLNGSVVRLDAQTELEFFALKSRDSQDEASFLLKSGQMWLKRSEEQSVRAAFNVSTDHLEVNSFGTIFEVETGIRESVRVIDGKVKVLVKVKDSEQSSMRTADTIDVVMGQEVSLGQSDILNLQNKKSVSLLALLSDEFRSSEWYQWNRSEDISGAAAGVAVKDAVNRQNEVSPVSAAEGTSSVIEPPPVEVLVVLSAPEIFAPKPKERVIKTGSVAISGTVSSATEKIEIYTYIEGKEEMYVLKKYKAGSENFSYVASREYGNLVPGENRFKIIAVGKDAKRSDPTEITVTYDRPAEPADLSAPQVLTLNGEATKAGEDYSTDKDEVVMAGKIGKGISKVIVNDFTLTRYVPDSGVWSYYAKKSFDNFKDGENIYKIYGVDFDGNKTPVTEIKIIKEAAAPPAESPASVPIL